MAEVSVPEEGQEKGLTGTSQRRVPGVSTTRQANISSKVKVVTFAFSASKLEESFLDSFSILVRARSCRLPPCDSRTR